MDSCENGTETLQVKSINENIYLNQLSWYLTIVFVFDDARSTAEFPGFKPTLVDNYFLVWWNDWQLIYYLIIYSVPSGCLTQGTRGGRQHHAGEQGGRQQERQAAPLKGAEEAGCTTPGSRGERQYSEARAAGWLKRSASGKLQFRLQLAETCAISLTETL